MINIQLLTAAAIISLASGKISFGLCSKEATQLTWEDY